MVNITENPQSTDPVMVGETAMFTCQARSIPSPTITWFRFQNGMEVALVDNDDDNISITSQSQSEDSFTTRSVLSVRVTGDEDLTEYFCVGDNQFDNSTSGVATLVRMQAGMFPGPAQLCCKRRKAGRSLGMRLVCQCLVMSVVFTLRTLYLHPCTPLLRFFPPGLSTSCIVHETHTFYIYRTHTHTHCTIFFLTHHVAKITAHAIWV